MKTISKKAQILKRLLIIFIISLTFTLAGCTAMIHNAIIKSFPSLAETEKLWPPLQDNEGRVVIYYPRLPAAGCSVIGVGGFDIRRVTVDDKYKSSLMDQTFIFIDLEAGEHTVMYKGHMYKKRKLDFNLAKNETKFIVTV